MRRDELRRAMPVAFLVGTLVATTACHTMRFEVADGTESKVVYHRKSYFLGGLVPTLQVDVALYCPNGAVAIREETTFVDGLLRFVTLGVWTPRSSWYYCAAEQARS